MSEPRRDPATLRRVWRGAWKDGWIAAWLAVTAFNMAIGFAHLNTPWVDGAFFGGAIGLIGGYCVTMQRNYRRTRREDLEFQLRQLRELELRVIARPHPLRDEMLDDIRDGRRQLAEALEGLR